MSQPRATTTTRIGVLAGVFGAALCVVLVHLWFLMVRDQEVWARRSYENRWAFRSVPSLRGRLLDRDGAVLAHDEPTSRVSVHYLRFRLRNCIGAAVHGGTVCLRLEPGMAFQRYRYSNHPNDPRKAVRDLFSMRASAIQPGVLPKAVTAQLATYATTVLSQLGDISRREAYRAMREAAQSGRNLGIGDVLAIPRGELIRRFDARVDELEGLGAKLEEAQVAYAKRRGLSDKEVEQSVQPLMEQLDALCEASFNKEQLVYRDELMVEHKGSLVEEVRKLVAEDVSFDIAAVLRVEAQRYAGITVEPSVRRVITREPGSSYDALVGRVNWLDRTVGKPDWVRTRLTGTSPPNWVETYLDEHMPKNWVDQLVPEGLVVDETRLLMVDQARRRYERELMTSERRGITGFEAWFNDELMGQLGMRFVEHDGNRREQTLWSHLRVESGNDVQITIDSRLQALAQAEVDKNQARFERDYLNLEDPKRQAMARYVEAAIVIIDANTGDVLACAGAPIVTDNARHVPGVMWNGNGSIGSVAKPFVLVEHLESQRLGRPHMPSSEIDMCTGSFTYAGQKLYCPPKHWGGGQSPRAALVQSCNSYFYHVAKGLGEDAVFRGFERFGLLQRKVAPEYKLCWQGQIEGISAARGDVDPRRVLPSKAVGYGIQVSPLIIARAYAGIGTGVLPTLGLRHGQVRDGIRVPAAKESLDFVRLALRDVLRHRHGTANMLTFLDDMKACGKTGTAERSDYEDNNAWFAGYFPGRSEAGHQLAFCSVLYYVPNDRHGGDTAGRMLQDFFKSVRGDPELAARYLPK